MKRDKLLRILIFLAMLLFGLCIIFFFSDQSGLMSNKFSTSIANRIAVRWNEIFHLSWTEKQMADFTHALNGPIRKLAHLIEYTFLGVIAFGGMRFVQGNRTKKSGVFIVMYLIVMAAVVDEINQYASHGRGASVRDVIIDTIGGVFGMYLFLILRDLLIRIRNLFVKKNDIEPDLKNGSQCS